MLAIVISRADEASVNIGDQLLEMAEWEKSIDETHDPGDGGGVVYRLDDVELRYVDGRHLDTRRVADVFSDPDLLVFASRHAGDTGPLLTAHHTGNFGPAELGGEDESLARAAPEAHRHVVHALSGYAPDGYDVGMEGTHHGPTDVGVPSMFVEVGSDEQQWADPDASRAVARAILSLRTLLADSSPVIRTHRQLVGFGGGHYAPRFERIVRETDWAVGHVAPDWALDAMGDPADNASLVRKAFERSNADVALLDGTHPKLRETIVHLGYRCVSETWLRETDGVLRDLVERITDRLGSVDDGIRFGDRGRGYDGRVTVESIDGEFLQAVRAIDPHAVRDVVESESVAFETTQNGTQVAESLAMRERDDIDTITSELCGLLEEKYDSVTRSGSEVVVRTSAFDPRLAHELGVPEGPKYGRLSAGESVEIDGKTIHPNEVFTERTRRFTL